MCSAVCPLAFCALTSSALLAVALSSILISGRWPFCAEMCNAVLPLLTFCRAAPPSAPSQQAARVWGGISSWQERHGRTCLAMAVGSTLIIAATSSSLFLHRRPFAEHHAQTPAAFRVGFAVLTKPDCSQTLQCTRARATAPWTQPWRPRPLHSALTPVHVGVFRGEGVERAPSNGAVQLVNPHGTCNTRPCNGRHLSATLR